MWRSLVVFLAFLSVVPPAARAAFPCMGGPGEFQVGVDRVNNVPLCQQRADAPDTSFVDAPRPFTAQDRSIAGRIADFRTILNAITGTVKGAQAETKDSKEVARLRAGYWDFPKPPKGAAKGAGCSATYFTLDGAITIAGPSGVNHQASITFWGGKIPVTKKGRTAKVTLAQTDSPTDTVQAYLFALADGQIGGVTFAVPSAKSLVGGMLDRHMFAVSSQKAAWLKVTWRDGLKARKRLARCLGI